MIFTDSLSIVDSLMSNINHSALINNHILCDIKKMLYVAFNREIAVSIVWIPSHVGIAGNERVDSLAKDARTCGVVPCLFSLPVSDYVRMLRTEVGNEWGEMFAKSSRGSYYRSIQPTIPKEPWFRGIKVSKHSVSLLCRLRIGHTVLASHLKRIQVVTSSLCVCEEEEETADHVLFNCRLLPNHDFFREISLIGLTFPLSVQHLLSLNSPKINKAITNHLKKYNKNV